MIRQQVFTLLEVSFQVAYIHLIANDLSKKRILPTSSYLLKNSTTSITTKDQRKWVYALGVQSRERLETWQNTGPHSSRGNFRPYAQREQPSLALDRISTGKYCRFPLSHHHQNHSTNNVNNQRGKRRWIFKQCRKYSGLCNVSCGKYSKKCFTQIYKATYGDTMFVSLWGAQIWRPEVNKNICHRVFYKEPEVVFWGLINIYMRT